MDSGSSIPFKTDLPNKTCFPIVVIIFGIYIFDNFLQPQKILLPSLTIFSGILILSKFEHSENAP